jgi:hypothetical protein
VHVNNGLFKKVAARSMLQLIKRLNCVVANRIVSEEKHGNSHSQDDSYIDSYGGPLRAVRGVRVLKNSTLYASLLHVSNVTKNLLRKKRSAATQILNARPGPNRLAPAAGQQLQKHAASFRTNSFPYIPVRLTTGSSQRSTT